MSYDELPPDAQPPQSEDAAATPAAQDPSSQDAPPAASTRRRRARTAGTDAASEAETTPITTPARTTRRRTAVSAAGTTHETDITPATETGAEAVTDQTTATPEPARRRRVAKSEPAATAAEATAETPPAPALPITETPAPARRTRQTRSVAPSAAEETAAETPSPADPLPETPPTKPPRKRGRRATGETGADALASVAPQTIGTATPGTPTPETAIAATSALETATSDTNTAEPDQVKPDQVKPDQVKPDQVKPDQVKTEAIERPGISAERISGDEIVAAEIGMPTVAAEADATPGIEAETEPSEAISAGSEPVDEATAAVPETVRKPRGRQRNPRSRRQASEVAPAAAGIATPETVEAEHVPLSTVSETAAEETASAEPLTESAPTTVKEPSEPRKRGNRRNGRNRRGGKEVASVEETATETPVGIAEEVVLAEPVEVPIDLSVGTHLIVRNGLPTLHIDGVAVPPVLFFGNLEGMKNRQRVLSEVRRAARAGIHLHSTLVELPCPLSESGDARDEIDSLLRALLEADPEGYVMPRIVFVPARGWKREYPTEISTYADGTTGDPSLTSVRFWQECERSLEALIAHIQNQVWGNRVFGYHLERGEWFQPADLGFDRSMANRDAFRDWLREKYRHDLVALRAAWYDGDVQFHTAEIPTVIAKPNPQRAFYETRRERSQIDFNEFTSESTARRLITLARTVKKAAGNNALVSLCYGYTFEFGHGYSGHLALDLLLAEPSIDLICGPPSYRDRKPGGAASIPAPVDSLLLHGKLWLSEDDTKTYLAPTQQAPDDFNPRLSDRFQTEQAQNRAMGRALATDTAIGWMDLWGEGWLDEDVMWDRIGTFTSRLRVQQEREPHLQAPEVVVLVDEKSLLHIQKGELFFRRLTNGLHDTLQRVGASYAIYLQSDLLHPDFPTGSQLYLFLTPYRLPAEQRAVIQEKLQGGGKTLAWLFAPGTCEARPGVGGLMEETATGATGLILRQQAWNSEIGSRIIVPNHAVTERLGGKDIGSRERLNPSFYLDDPGATVLAEYQGSGLASLAVKDHGGWKSVFVGDPVLPLELLRGICRYAGVHLWTGGGEDVVCVGNGWVMVHASRDGQRTLRLPAPSPLYDVTERRLIADEVRDYRYFLRAGNTRIFYTASLAQMRHMGLPNIPDETVSRHRIVLDDSAETDRLEPPKQELAKEYLETALPEPVSEPDSLPLLPPAISPALNTDLETLKAVLSMEMPDTDDFIEEEPDDLEISLINMDPAPASATLAQVLGAEMAHNGRRRRRRGGRGRGKRRETATDVPDDNPTAGPQPEPADRTASSNAMSLSDLPVYEPEDRE